MTRQFVYHIPSARSRRPSVWVRAGATLNRWFWAVLCCGHPGVPCYFCSCCVKEDDTYDVTRSCVNQSTATIERIVPRLHRPHAPRGRKPTPEMLLAVKYALSQLQGEPGLAKRNENEKTKIKDSQNEPG